MLQLIRIMQVLANLSQTRTITANELARELEVSSRTIIRDIQSLKDAGAPILSTPEGYKLEEASWISSLSMSGEEKFVMLAGLQMVVQSKDPSLQRIASRLTEKLLGGTNILGTTPVLSGPTHHEEENLKKVRRLRVAVDMRKWVTFNYVKPNSSKAEFKDIRPLAVFFRRHAFYLVGFPKELEQPRMYRINRIKNLAIQKESFKSVDFDIQSYLDDAFEFFASGPVEEVVIMFDKSVAPFISELVWHPRQKLEPLPDGSLRFSLKVSINQEIVRWILQYGGECEVISPKILRDMVKEQAVRMSHIYNR
jgi:predicted DNA-binding transcriptional regulator YafY